ncbi:MAG: DUF2497 domain-containing protein, partial [Hyphomicrobiaceae bacterium]
APPPANPDMGWPASGAAAPAPGPQPAGPDLAWPASASSPAEPVGQPVPAASQPAPDPGSNPGRPGQPAADRRGPKAMTAVDEDLTGIVDEGTPPIGAPRVPPGVPPPDEAARLGLRLRSGVGPPPPVESKSERGGRSPVPLTDSMDFVRAVRRPLPVGRSDDAAVKRIVESLSPPPDPGSSPGRPGQAQPASPAPSGPAAREAELSLQPDTDGAALPGFDPARLKAFFPSLEPDTQGPVSEPPAKPKAEPSAPAAVPVPAGKRSVASPTAGQPASMAESANKRVPTGPVVSSPPAAADTDTKRTVAPPAVSLPTFTAPGAKGDGHVQQAAGPSAPKPADPAGIGRKDPLPARSEWEPVAAMRSGPEAPAGESVALVPSPSEPAGVPMPLSIPAPVRSVEPVPLVPVVLPPQTAAVPNETLVPSVRTLEDTVAELLRPMLRQWLDQNMPRVLEKALRVEVAEGLRSGKIKPGDQ